MRAGDVGAAKAPVNGTVLRKRPPFTDDSVSLALLDTVVNPFEFWACELEKIDFPSEDEARKCAALVTWYRYLAGVFQELTTAEPATIWLLARCAADVQLCAAMLKTLTQLLETLQAAAEQHKTGVKAQG